MSVEHEHEHEPDRSLGERLTTVENAVKEFRGKFEHLEHHFNVGFQDLRSLITGSERDRSSNKRFSIQLVAGLLVFIVPMVCCLWFVITLQINAVTKPLEMQQATLGNQQLNNNQQLYQAQGDINGLRITIASHNAERLAKETEIETQFNAEGQMRNLQFAEQHRMNAIMWNSLAAQGGKLPDYPTGPYFQPNISRSVVPMGPSANR